MEIGIRVTQGQLFLVSELGTGSQGPGEHQDGVITTEPVLDTVILRRSPLVGASERNCNKSLVTAVTSLVVSV